MEKDGKEDQMDYLPPPPPEEDPIVTATLFSTLQALTIHSQENKSFALYNFLLFNSFLLMGWMTIFSQLKCWTDAAISILICLVGFMAAGVWKQLLIDYARASDSFRDYLEKNEKFLPLRWQGPHADRMKQIVKRDEQARKKNTGNWDLLTWVPNMFRFLYISFIVLSLIKLLN